jgi:methyl-accepting chemotaxis protein
MCTLTWREKNVDPTILKEFLIVLGVTVGLVVGVNLLHFMRHGTGLQFKLAIITAPLLLTVTPAGWMIGKYGLNPQVIVTASVLALLAAAFKSYATRRWVIRPIQALKTYSEEIAQGNLGATLDLSQRDEMGEMAATLRAMCATLQGIMTEVRLASDTVAAAAEQTHARIRETSEAMGQLGARTHHVAQSAEVLSSDVSRTTALMQGIISSIQGVAQTAEETSEVKSLASRAAETGSAAVSKTVQAMGGIEASMLRIVAVIEELGRSSAEIGTIMGLIDGIAKKTNLLALNAAIEAARAGEHGKGFAVVADEVRRLAEHSAQATGDSAKLLLEIQNQIDEALLLTRHGSDSIQGGMALAQSTGVALDDIVASMSRVADRLEEIRLATREQATSGNGILRSVESMTRLTQQVSSATSEQEREGSRMQGALEDIYKMGASLQQEAQTLREAIAFFKQAELRRTIPQSLPALRRD